MAEKTEINSKFFTSVRLDQDLCKGCINCIKRCPTQAIRVRNHKAVITKEFCIDCGECIRICPHHAKLPTYDKLSVIENYEYTVALPAPSLYGQFNNLDDVNIVLTALKKIGFDGFSLDNSSRNSPIDELVKKGYVVKEKRRRRNVSKTSNVYWCK